MHATSPLISILVVLAAALVSATILLRLKQPNLIGFILAGMLVGPHGLGLVPYENVELLSEVGIGLLMFTIGVELSIQQLMRVKWVATIGGTGLIIGTTLVSLLIAPLFRWTHAEAMIWGITAGLSSTVVVLKLLAERGEVGSTHGNVCTGILLFQDVISIPLLVLVPIIAGSAATEHAGGAEKILLLVAKLVVFLFVLYFLGRTLVPRLLRLVANTHSKELFSISVLCLTFGIAGLTNQLGLSLALGAFLAGLIVSDSDFGNQAASEVLPLKDSFSAVFFVSVGMLLDVGFIIQRWPAFVLGLLFIILLKFTLLTLIGFLFRYQAKITVFLALALAQIGEFGFLILLAAHRENVLSENSYQKLLGIAVLSIVLTPYLLKSLSKVKRAFAWINKTAWISRNTDLPKETPAARAGAAEPELSGHIIVCGYGPTGSIVAKKMQNLGFPVVVVDLNYKVIQGLKANKQRAVYGDSSSLIVLEAAHIKTAALLVVTIPDPLAMQSLVKKVKTICPKLPVVMRVKYMSDRDKLLALGADDIVWEEFEAGQELARRAMSRLDVQPTG